jgi:hypothetical protein
MKFKVLELCPSIVISGIDVGQLPAANPPCLDTSLSAELMYASFSRQDRAVACDVASPRRRVKVLPYLFPMGIFFSAFAASGRFGTTT